MHAVATSPPFICFSCLQSGFCFHYVYYYIITAGLVNPSKFYTCMMLFYSYS